MADVTAGEVFATAQSVTAARLNNHVNGLTILPAFISAKPTITPVAADRILTYQISGDQLNAPTITNILALQLSDQSAATPSMRTLGTSAVQAAQGSLTPQLAADNIFTGTSNKFKHIKGTVGVTVAAGSAVGTGSVSLSTGATDLSGRISISVTTGVANDDLCTVTFGVAFVNNPNVVLMGYDQAGAINQSTTKVFTIASVSTTGFIVNSGTVAPSNGTSVFSYIVTGVGT